MATKHDVIRLNKEHPDWTAGMIAIAIGAVPEYVNATAKRNKLTLAKARKARKMPLASSLVALGRAARHQGLTVETIKNIWACTGCGSIKSLEQIRTEHPDAIACCPERKMAPIKGHVGAIFHDDLSGATK